MELAAAGVSIALFNQASRITIFPLVSITTSFVAEEETVGRVGITEEEKSSENKTETKESTPEDDMLEDMEKGEAGTNGDNLGRSTTSPKNRGIKGFSMENMTPEDVEKGAAETSKSTEMKESMPQDLKHVLGKSSAEQNVDNAESSSAKEGETKEFMQGSSPLEDVDVGAMTKSGAKESKAEDGTSLSPSLSLSLSRFLCTCVPIMYQY